MSSVGQDRQVYAVVLVERGMASSVYCYTSKRAADSCARRLRAGRNLIEDDIAILQARMDTKPSLDDLHTRVHTI